MLVKDARRSFHGRVCSFPCGECGKGQLGFGGEANDVPTIVEVDASVGHVVVTIATLGGVVVWTYVLSFNKESRA